MEARIQDSNISFKFLDLLETKQFTLETDRPLGWLHHPSIQNNKQK
jgi:hypothetical protein